MTAIMLLNMHSVLRQMLDAFVSARMRQSAAAAEYAWPRPANHR